jgi:hypothetical protein
MIRHQAHGITGTLEIVNFGAALFRRLETGMYITEEIRLGEWIVTSRDDADA